MAGHEIGLGHLNRCITIGSSAQKLGFGVSFAVFGNLENHSASSIIQSRGIFTEQLICEREFSNANLEKLSEYSFDVIFIDILYSNLFFSRQLIKQLNILSTAACYSAFIDTLGENSVMNFLPKVSVDLVVRPYVVDTSDYAHKIAHLNYKILEGGEYAILGQEYLSLPQREVRNDANRILVTCGGSDARSNTLAILSSLEMIEFSLHVKVVIGPLFEHRLCSLVELFESKSRHKISVVKNPLSLMREMLWCDLAIGSNGLTKYELAATGTPSVLFSVDEYHNHANLEFSKKNTAIHLGVGISKEKLAKEVAALLGSVARRRIMIGAGKALIDGGGAERLLIEITRGYLAKKRIGSWQ